MNPQLVRPAGTGAGSGSDRIQTGSERGLPDDLLQTASRRLSIAALLISVTYLVAWLLGRWTTVALMEGAVSWTTVDGSDAIAVVSIALSVALCLCARRDDFAARLILDIGLVYMVLLCAGLGLLMHWTPMPHMMPASPMISWAGPIILIFAAILPTTTGKTLIASLLAVSMNPIAMMLAKARGSWDYGPESRILLMHYPDFLLVPVAVVISRVVTGLGQQVAKAREMGSYQLGERIGRGAMGDVYRATHRMFARPGRSS